MAQDFLPPDYQEELDAANRRKMLAMAYLQQGLGQGPQGQMVSGHYVRSSPTQHLAQIAKVLTGQYMAGSADKEAASTRRRFLEDQAQDLARIQALATGTPGGPTPNFVMQLGANGEPEMANTPAVPGDPLKAEQQAQQSRFPASQALGKALMENRLKRLSDMQKELAGRVPLEQVPQIYSGQTEGLTPRPEHRLASGIPYQTSEAGIRFTGQPTQFTQRVGDKDVLMEMTPDGRVRAVAGDQPNVSASVAVNPEKAVPAIASSRYGELAKAGDQLRELATRTLPRMSAVAQAVKQGIVQGSMADIRKPVFDFARLLGIGSDEFKRTLDRTGGVESALAAISAETIKQYGSNPSNIDLVNQMKAVGSLGAGPEQLYQMMNLAQAMIYNAAVSHQRAVSNYQKDFPELAGRTNSLLIGQLPRISIDEQVAHLNPETGFFEAKVGHTGAAPEQGLFGPRRAQGPKRLQDMSVEELEARRRQLQGTP